MKRYGIFLGYSPSADLRVEGLGRHLASFLTAALRREDVRFSIACPSWTRARVVELCRAYGIDAGAIDFVGPQQAPLLLRAHKLYQHWRRQAHPRGRLKRFVLHLARQLRRTARGPVRALVGMRSLWLAPLFIIAAAVAVVVLVVLDAARLVVRILASSTNVAGSRGHGHVAAVARRMLGGINRAAQSPSSDPRTHRLFGLMEEAEMNSVIRDVARRSDIVAWYCPAPFWPQFNAIDAPRLQCVPDVVLSEFPVGFARFASARVAETFRKVERTIAGGDRFVTYSEAICQSVLLDRYHVDRERVSVVLHGTDRLDDLIRVSGFADSDAATDAYCRGVLEGALHKSIGHPDPTRFVSAEFRFLFYASQFRPNKNLRMLLRAFDELLRRRHVSVKLVLTGDPAEYADFGAALDEYGLRDDVLCLHGLSSRELAACYRLARLAINPSVAEGGMPFTFAEAVSVGTPVVMADIAVTREVIVDPQLRSRTLFDPFDATAMADKMETALAERDSLHALQRRFFDTTLALRGWDDVVAEHVDILDSMSVAAGNRAAA